MMLSYWNHEKTIFIHSRTDLSNYQATAFRRHIMFMDFVMVFDNIEPCFNKLKFLKNRYGGISPTEDYSHNISEFFELIPPCNNMLFVLVINGIQYPSVTIPQHIISVEKFVTGVCKSVIENYRMRFK